MLNTFRTVTGKFSVMIKKNLLYVFGSCERHSKPMKEMDMPLRPTPKRDTFLGGGGEGGVGRLCKLGK